MNFCGVECFHLPARGERVAENSPLIFTPRGIESLRGHGFTRVDIQARRSLGEKSGKLFSQGFSSFSPLNTTAERERGTRQAARGLTS